MAANNSRQDTRRKFERRSKERRINPFEFGSDEWREMIQKEYLLWPKQDRRIAERRSATRRQGNRRVKNNGAVRMPRQINNLHDLLTNEERDMLNDLSQSDSLD